MLKLWTQYTAAPHRVMFLPGAVFVVLAMLWWLIDLESRRHGGTGLSALPGSALHVWWMLYGIFPFFIFGFLFTAAPNWLNGPAIPRSFYLACGLTMAAGAGVLLAGLVVPGLLLHLAGLAVGVLALMRCLTAAPSQDKTHAILVTAATALGGVGEALLLVWAGAEVPDALALAQGFGLWGFLVPVYLTVCHRMIPWFTSRIVSNYVLIRPYAPFFALLAGGLIHAALGFLNLGDWLWLVDLPMAAIVFWYSSRWGVARGVRQVRLLAMLHIGFLWAGVAFLLFALDSLAAWAGLAWRAGQAPLHVLGIGFCSSMLIAMASRVSLGHSGGKLVADDLTWGLFWLIQVVAVIRALPEVWPALPPLLVSMAAALWLLAFGLWAWRYAPLTWRPRGDGKPG